MAGSVPSAWGGGGAVQRVVERRFGWLSHWGGLVGDRAARLDVAAARLALAAVLAGVEALLNPVPIRDERRRHHSNRL